MSELIAGEPCRLDANVVRMIARNAGMMTGPGTNGYFIGDEELTMIDPGPVDADHVKALADFADGRLRQILVTHTHRDHSPAAAELAKLTGAEVFGMRAPTTPENDQHFQPDHVIEHDELIDCDGLNVRAIHTPGHASNHVCYLLQDSGMLFTGDHIMNGSTVVITAPDGNMRAYLASLALLKDYSPKVIAPGHGDLMNDPNAVVDWIIAHRLEREAKVVERLRPLAPCTIDTLLPEAYDEVDPRLLPIARYSLQAHLGKLLEERRAVCVDGLWDLID